MTGREDIERCLEDLVELIPTCVDNSVPVPTA